MTFRKFFVLVGIVVFSTIGEILLSRGMKQIGAISPARWMQAIAAILNPSVALGILFLLAFFAAYLTALSWADLTYVLPATSFGFILLALLSHWLLHENVSAARWLGILLISAGVAFIAGGPMSTPAASHQAEAVGRRAEP